MLLVGLTGGIGSGQVARSPGLLGEHGAVILDADVFARDAVGAGIRRVRGGRRTGSATRWWVPTASSIGAKLASHRVRGPRGARGPRGDRPPRGPSHDRRRHPGRARHRPRRRAREPAADRDGRASRLRRGRRDLGRRRRPRSPGRWRAGWTRPTCARGSPRNCRSRSAPARPTCCSTTRARSRSSRREVAVLWSDARRTRGRRLSRPVSSCACRLRAVLFDAGETLVHPAPSFPELFARVLADAGHRRDPDAVLEASRQRVPPVLRGRARQRAVDDVSPERSERVLEGRVRPRCSTSSASASTSRLRDALYATFTDPANYALFDDVLDAIDRARGRRARARHRVELRGVARGSPRDARRARPVPGARDQRSRGRREAGRRASSTSRSSGSAPTPRTRSTWATTRSSTSSRRAPSG